MPSGDSRLGYIEGLMANRNFQSQRIYSMHAMPVLVDANIAIGSSGAVGTILPSINSLIKAVTRLAAGVYKIQLSDNYAGIYKASVSMQSPVTGSNVASTALTPGVLYQITVVGTTNWQTAGLPANVVPAVGQAFVAAATATGTGQAKVIAPSGIEVVELVGSVQLPSDNSGAIMIIQCLGATDASTTTLIPKDPASGSIMFVQLLMNNSSLTG
jgi:hypothetical protein